MSSFKNWFLLILVFVFGTRCLAVVQRGMPPEKVLIQRLLNDYAKLGKHGRPVLFPNQSINVELSLELHSLVDVDDENQQPSITVHCWLSQRWTDPLLTWDPSAYAGLEEVVVPIKDIWSPDTTLYNGLDTNNEPTDEKTAVVQQNGAVAWVLPRKFKVICDRIDANNYPFDGLKCFLKFGSWTTSGAKIKYQLASENNDFSMATYIPDPQWRVSSHFASRKESFYSCCPDTPFVDLSFHLKLRRAKPSSAMGAMFPLVILGLLISAPFVIPGKTAVRVQIACTTFFALLFYGALLVFIAPHSRNSNVVLCFQLELCNAGMAIILSAWFSEMRDCRKPAPRCVIRLFQTLAVVVLCRCWSLCCRICCRKGDSSDRRRSSLTVPTASMSSLAEAKQTTNSIGHRNNNNNNRNSMMLISSADNNNDTNNQRRHSTVTSPYTIRRDWRTIAGVLNAATASLFLVSNCLILLANFPKPADGSV